MLVPGAPNPMLLAGGFVFNYVISANTNNFNLRTAALAAGWDGVAVLTATVTVNSGVYVGSSSTSVASFDTGTPFPSGSTHLLVNNGFILGRGGLGGNGGNQYDGLGGTGGAGQPAGSTGPSGGNNTGLPGSPGGAGGPALQVALQTTVVNNGTIGGGGGGGGGAGNGSTRGLGGAIGFAGTSGSGGVGGGAGGNAGACVIGNSNITWSVTGTRLGAIA